MKINTFKIDKDGKIFINGIEVNCLTSFQISSKEFQRKQVTITFDADVEICSNLKDKQ